MLSRIQLSGDDLEAVAAGRAGPEVLDTLAAGQLTRRRLLLLALRQELAAASLRHVDSIFALLDAAETAAPAAANAVIGRPFTRAWAVRTITGLRTRGLKDADVAADVDHLSSIAAAVAVRAGLSFELPVTARAGSVHLPGTGCAVGLDREHVVVRGDGVSFAIDGADGPVTTLDNRWQPAHVVTLDQSDPWCLELDDQDPYRDCFGYRPAPRLDTAARTEPADLVAAAWQLLVTDHPHRAALIRATLRSLVPLAGGEAMATPAGGVALSASSQHAYGSVAALVPRRPATLALLLVHEVQHMALGGVLDIVDLCVPGGVARHQAPWRADPRPVGALLQGVFAHLGVTDFWRVHRLREASGSADRDWAEFEFAYWRETTTRAIRALGDSGELTAAGEHFVNAVASTMDTYWSETVPTVVAAAARDVAEADGVLWRVRNQEPAADTVDQLARMRQSGATCGAFETADIRTQPATPARRSGLSAGIRERLRQVTSGHIDGPGSPVSASNGVTPTDMDSLAEHRALLTGDLDAAVLAYRGRIAANPDDDDAWVGLTVALMRTGEEPAATVLSQRPDLVRALYVRSATGPGDRAAPDDLATWLSTGLARSSESVHYGEGGSM